MLRRWCADALPDLPEPDRRRRPRDASRSSTSVDTARGHRGRRRARRSSTGPCRASGTCAPRGSPTRPAMRIVDYAESNLHVVGYSRPPPRDADGRGAAPSTFTRCRSIRTGSPTGPPTGPTRGASASRRTQRAAIVPDERVRGRASTPTLEDGQPDVRRGRVPRARRDEEVLLSTYVCHPSLCERQRVRDRPARRRSDASSSGRCPALHVPLPVQPRHGRTASRGSSQNLERLGRIEARARRRVRGRRRARSRYKRSRRGDRRGRPGRRARAPRIAAGAARRGLRPVGRRRAAVLLARASICPSASLTRTPHGQVSPSTTPRRTTWISSAPESLADSLAAPLEIVDVLERERDVP